MTDTALSTRSATVIEMAENPRTRRPHPKDGIAWYPETFGFYSTADNFHEMLRILGDGKRVPWGHLLATQDPKLPIMRCGATGVDGRPCGLAIREKMVRATTYCYESTHCKTGSAAHFSRYPRSIERPILEVIAKAYTVERLESAFRDAAGRLATHQVELRAARRARVSAQADYDRWSIVENDVREGLQRARAGNEAPAIAEAELDVAHAVSQRRRAQAAYDASDLAYARLERLVHGVERASELERARASIMSIAKRLPLLFRRARVVRGLSASLIGMLTSCISLRRVGPRLALVEVEFPNGAKSRFLFATGDVQIAQPVGAFVASEVRRGTSMARIETSLAPCAKRNSIHQYKPSELGALALVWKFAPPPDLRVGPSLSLDGIRDITGDDSTYLFVCAMNGAFGPAAVDETNTLTFTPTAEELTSYSIAYCKRCVAHDTGWPLDDLSLRTDLADEMGRSRDWLRMRQPWNASNSLRDAQGRLWVRRSACDPSWWRQMSPEQLRRDQEERIAGVLRRARFDPTTSADWIPTGDLLRIFRAHKMRINRNTVLAAVTLGRVAATNWSGPSLPGRRHPPRQIVYAPRVIWEEPSRTTIDQWLRGELVPVPTSTIVPKPRKKWRSKDKSDPSDIATEPEKE
jgi:hypothetical protein